MKMPAEVFHPGSYLRDELKARGWTQKKLAKLMGRPAGSINHIVNEKCGISALTAEGLSKALGTSPEVWINLWYSYQLWKHKKDQYLKSLSLEERRKILLEAVDGHVS